MEMRLHMKLVSPCHFGMEAVLKRELLDLGIEIESVEDGKITYLGDASTICLANMFLRTTERVLIQVGKFKATTFDELFEGIKQLEWERYIPIDGKFWGTKATSIKSKLFSPSDIQSIVKKSIVERLKTKYNVTWFNEEGASYPIRVNILKDEVTVTLDTSGVSLHKRGYRKLAGKAPITETLAAAIILLSPWKADRILVDPFCGSGTIPIEAAMIGANIAPGMNRSFIAEEWKNIIPMKEWYRVNDMAADLVKTDVTMNIQGYDIDDQMIRICRENAKMAEVDQYIHFQQRPLSELSNPKKYGFIITNPPYGERLEEKKVMPALYEEIGRKFNQLDSWSCFMITGYEDAPKYMGRKADKNRKIYNGMMKTYLYQYMGPKPPKKPKETDNK